MERPARARPFDDPRAAGAVPTFRVAGPRDGDPIDGPTLFDLAADPAETKNVAAANPEVVKDLLARAEKFRE